MNGITKLCEIYGIGDHRPQGSIGHISKLAAGAPAIEPRKSPSILRELKQAKEHSDNRQYKDKAGVMRGLLTAHTDDFFVDSELNKNIVGVTHIPTGFRMHLLRQDIPPVLLEREDMSTSKLAFMKKVAVVRKVDGKWVLYTKDKSRVLGTHETPLNPNASDVPHAHLITSIGKIPSKYIEFDEEQPVTKQAGLLKKSVHWSDDVSRNILNGKPYPVSYLTGELDELKESIKNRDWNNFKEELGDSTYAAEMILAQRLGLNLPLIGASSPVDKFYARKKKWEELFDERGVPFNNDYLSGGSNLKKPKKIQAALGLAGHTITKDEARALALKHGGEIEDDWGDVPTI